MKTKLILAAFVSSFIIHHSAFAQGSLTPPAGAPAPVMKSLAQIEPRTPISAVPITITNAGSYYLTTNVTTAVSNAIVIATNGVTLDLAGFTIFSTVANATNGGSAILLTPNINGITIQNGHISGGVTNNGAVFSGKGFAYGILSLPNQAANVLVSRVSVSGCLGEGIYLDTSGSTVVESCTVSKAGGEGILATVVKNCSATDCGTGGITGSQVSDSRGESLSSDFFAVGLYAKTAVNCYGKSSGGHALYTVIAQNCVGECFNGFGIYAEDIAIGCRGSTYTGTALYAFIANSCRGVIYTSGTAISTSHNVNSF